MPDQTLSPPLRCSTAEIATYLLRGRLLQNGCSAPEADAVSVKPYAFSGVHPVLAVVYVRDPSGALRELHRVYDLDDLSRFVDDAQSCAFLARSVRRIAGDE